MCELLVPILLMREELVPIVLMHDELVPILICKRNWYQFYTCRMNWLQFFTLEFRESDVSPGQTEVIQGKFVEFVSGAKGYFRETYKSQIINPISPSPKFTLGRGCLEQNICYHKAAFMIPFNLIYHMTMF